MDFIPFSQAHTEEVIRLWNEQIGDEFPLSQRLFQQNSLHDKTILWQATWVALDQGRVIGYVLSKISSSISDNKDAWIQALLVDRNYRGKGVGSALIERAEEALKAHSAGRIHLGRGPATYFPGIPTVYKHTQKWFEEKGYQQTELVHDLHRYYAQHEIIPLPHSEGVSLEFLSMEDKNKLVELTQNNFPQWAPLVKSYDGTGREFVVLKKENEIIGFCRINDQITETMEQNIYWPGLFEDELGGIGPLGVSPDYRGLGYGKLAVEGGVYFLKQRGIRNIVINWTNKPKFYEKLGYKIWKSYNYYEKQL